MSKTKFPKLSKSDFPDPWARFYHAGTDWLLLYQMLEDERAKPTGLMLFYVWPFAVGITIELFIKSLVSKNDPSFNPKSFRHNTTNIINTYKNMIPFLGKISSDPHLMSIIKSYEDTIDTKFGDTLVSISRDEEKLVMDLAYEIRDIIRIEAGFHN